MVGNGTEGSDSYQPVPWDNVNTRLGIGERRRRRQSVATGNGGRSITVGGVLAIQYSLTLLPPRRTNKTRLSAQSTTHASGNTSQQPRSQGLEAQ
jgi:hypothetical protein